MYFGICFQGNLRPSQCLMLYRATGVTIQRNVNSCRIFHAADSTEHNGWPLAFIWKWWFLRIFVTKNTGQLHLFISSHWICRFLWLSQILLGSRDASIFCDAPSQLVLTGKLCAWQTVTPIGEPGALVWQESANVPDVPPVEGWCVECRFWLLKKILFSSEWSQKPWDFNEKMV